MMLKMSLWFPLLAITVFHSEAAAPGSCVGRCGEQFTRGQRCTCDFSCQKHNECCPDFQSTCITAQSCRGRCDEPFQRGRVCECDSQCVSYNTCCHDYQLQCQAGVPVSHTGNVHTLRAVTNRKGRSKKKQRGSNSESEEEYAGRTLCRQHAGGRCLDTYIPLTTGNSGSPPHVVPNNRLQYTSGYSPANDQQSMTGAHAGLSHPAAAGSTLPGYGGSALGWDPALSVPGLGTAGGNGDVRIVHAPVMVDQLVPYPENLCNNGHIDGLSTLSNGTIVVFKGEYFWLVDPVSRSQGLPRSITETLGVPSPIDAAFTRCNCHGTIYLIKGDQVWRLDGNLFMEPGYPKPLASEFPQLTGNITAALALPATGGSPETVFFFRNGHIMQRFTFPADGTPPCQKTPASSLLRRVSRQAEVLLSGEINIRVSLEGFPTPVTSALSLSSPRTRHQDQQDQQDQKNKQDQWDHKYQHYVFSGPLFFRVQQSGDHLVLFKPDPSTASSDSSLLSSSAVTPTPDNSNPAAPPPPPPPPANSINRWLRCP